MRILIVALFLPLATLLDACTRHEPLMDVARIDQSSSPSAVSTPDIETEPVEFAKVVINIARGTKIGTYISPGLIVQCTEPRGLFWKQGRVNGRNMEFAGLFHDSLSQAGYDVVGDPSKMFGQAEQLQRAVYSVGAQIESIRMNVCDEAHHWDGRPLNRQKGEASVRVRWQVYSKLGQRVVYQTTTVGFARLETGVTEGETVLFQQAFAAAADNLAADTEFRNTLESKELEQIVSAGYATTAIPKIAAYRSPVANHMNEVRGATVTMLLNNGHGSGFVISKDGLILTNYHVVGEGKSIRVQFPSGLEVEGEVLRTHKQRDVALVRVPVRGLQVLPIRAAPARVGEEVYAIGTPVLRDLRASITRGIVSALRKEERTMLPLIQSDADIQGGNSGGPLVDARGNVIGISALGIGVEKMSAGLNFFIPIHDALAKLNMEIGKK